MLKEIIIIGGGPAGNTAALAAARLGAGSVLLVERISLGGTCTNRGCIPSKFYLSRSERLAAAGQGHAPPAEWPALKAQKIKLVQGLSRSIEATCRKRGVEVVRGTGRIEGPGEVSVEDETGALSRFTSPRIVVAAGSDPAELPGVRPDGERILTSTDALELSELPASIAVVGSGAVGAEFAAIFRRFGVEVTVVEAAERLFPQEEPEVDLLFRRLYDREGIAFRTGDAVAGVEHRGTGIAVRLASGGEILAERALLGVGRRLLTAGLGCEKAGIALGDRGEILVDENLRTSCEGIWAAGDITGKMLLAHVAAYQGALAAHRALGAAYPPVPYRSISWSSYTQPEVASVGMTEKGARRAGREVFASTRPLMESIKARIDRATEGFFKLVFERESGMIIGGTIVGPHASDTIHIIAMAIHGNQSISELRGFIFAHPSAAEVIGDVIEDVYNDYISMRYK